MKRRYIAMLFFMVISCSNPQKSDDNREYGPLMAAAQKTSLNFNSSAISRPGSVFVEVPKEYWEQDIINAKPIRVYAHNNNIALVLKETAQTEEGLYFFVEFSSYWPHNENGVTYAAIVKDKVFSFAKNK